MNTINKSVVLLSSVFFMSASLQAAPGGEVEKSKLVFEKLEQKADFIYGDNLVTDQLPESGIKGSVEAQSGEDVAASMGTVMVTANGDVYEAEVNAKDVAIFQNAIKELKKAGYSASIFTNASAVPTLPMAEKNGIDELDSKVVIGSDNRTQITNTVSNPYWYIGRIAIGCTGTLITKKHVLTAGHCVSNGNGSWYSSLDFTVAQDGSYKPWGSETWTNALTTTEWHNNRSSNHDYALIVLADAPHGGYAGWGVYSGGTHRISGYPGDKPLGTLWTHSGSPWTSGSYRLCYTIDTAGGQSGSGIMDSNNRVRGIHTTGSSSQNCGTKITSSVYNTVNNWISSNP